MGSLKPPKNGFSNEDIVELERVFASVCENLEAEQGKQDEAKKTRIRRQIFALACNGMDDPTTLRDELVRSFARSIAPMNDHRE